MSVNFNVRSVNATLLAALRRDPSITTALCDFTLDFDADDYERQYLAVPAERRGSRGAVTPISGAFPSADGFWMLSLGDATERWQTLMDWMQDPVLANDETLLAYEERLARRDMILDRIGAWATAYPKLEVVAEAQRRHIPSSPVNTSLELAQDAQLIDRRFLVEIDHLAHDGQESRDPAVTLAVIERLAGEGQGLLYGRLWDDLTQALERS